MFAYQLYYMVHKIVKTLNYWLPEMLLKLQIMAFKLAQNIYQNDKTIKYFLGGGCTGRGKGKICLQIIILFSFETIMEPIKTWASGEANITYVMSWCHGGSLIAIRPSLEYGRNPASESRSGILFGRRIGYHYLSLISTGVYTCA